MNEIDRCQKWIEAALERSGGTHLFSDVKGAIMQGTMQLWPAERGCVVTELVKYPRKKVLNLFLAGGDLDQILSMSEDGEKWAKSEGCAAMVMTGRHGWKKSLSSRDWTEAYVTFWKEL